MIFVNCAKFSELQLIVTSASKEEPISPLFRAISIFLLVSFFKQKIKFQNVISTKSTFVRSGQLLNHLVKNIDSTRKIHLLKC